MVKVNVGMMSFQGSDYVVLPVAEFERLKAGASEDARLIALGERHRHDATFPEDVARRLVAGEPPLKVIREWRAADFKGGMTQARLHELSGVSQVYISQIERKLNGRKLGRKTAEKLAPHLRVSADDLMD